MLSIEHFHMGVPLVPQSQYAYNGTTFPHPTPDPCHHLFILISLCAVNGISIFQVVKLKIICLSLIPTVSPFVFHIHSTAKSVNEVI